MPVYEYACGKCGAVTEALRRMADADEPIACEKCGSKKTARAKSVVAVGGSRDSSGGGGGGACEFGGCGAGMPGGPVHSGGGGGGGACGLG